MDPTIAAETFDKGDLGVPQDAQAAAVRQRELVVICGRFLQRRNCVTVFTPHV
jgi:hypothetical protein